MELVDQSLEFIDIEEEAEGVGQYRGFEFPVVIFRKYPTGHNDTIYLDAKATKHIGDKKFVKISCSTNYVVFSFPEKRDDSCFSLRKQGNCSLSLVWPAALRNAGIKAGAYKLYKCKDGFCVKRYEPLTA